MVERVGALDGHYQRGRFGKQGAPDVSLQLVDNLRLYQVAAWPECWQQVGSLLAKTIGAETAPQPASASSGDNGSMLRIEPLKWWLIDTAEPVLEAAQASIIDLSHARCRVRISGVAATTLLNRLLPLDLRERSFAVGSVASSAMHHIGVTLWLSQHGYELLLPRSFALSAWQVLFESAEQFGIEVI